ncbi:hypothetical protein [Pseudomonas frederiksbergensis]|uniref:hypothetical protein n=1 Tax=Pseudomonas frederiksbergensis TaxID=104087 RepID=UPI000F4A1D70|nr:hypothetical protein [Pseudomonas frederiksbergensis]RON44034.1 hypothetical protein BK667_27810 [Pseudomonas frederiksbergensis]
MEEHLFIRGQVAGKDLDSIRLADIQVKGDAGDRALIDALIDSLSGAIRRDTLRYEMPDTFALPAHCMLWQWLDVYLKAIQHTEFVTWAAQHHLDLKSLRVQGGTLYVNAVEAGVTTPRVMALDDDSGWWQVAGPINAVAQIIDPAGIDPFGLRDPSTASSQAFSLGATLAFHGYPLPANRPQAHVLVDELRRLSGFPVIDSSGHISTSVSVEQAEQVRDCAKLASELERALQDQSESTEEYDFLETYRRRIKLDSGSMLAQTMNSALRLLQGLSIKLNVGRMTSPTGYYFSRVGRTLMEIDRFSVPQAVAAERLAAPDVARDLLELAAQAEKLGSDVHSDGCFSLANVLKAYERETPANATEVRVLAATLRQAPDSLTPYVHASAHSAAALLRHRRYIGLLNNRYLMGYKLQVLSGAQADAAAVSTAGLNAYIDPDSPLSELTEVGKTELLAVMELDEFKQLMTTRQIDPAGHVLVTGAGYVGARKLDGTWIDLDNAVKANAVLAGKFQSLALIATRLGGALRSNGDVTLEQMLKFYSLAPPVTAEDARIMAQRLRAVPLRPQSAQEYWNALGGTFASVSSPLLSRRLQIIEEPEHFMPRIGTSLYYWAALKRAEVTVVLSAAQRQQVRDAAVQFMAGINGSLFDYLAQKPVSGKSRESVRAGADLLISQMLACPRAQRLADRLTLAVTWQGDQARNAITRAGRHSLVLAAAILSLDPQAGQNRNTIAGINLADEQFWADSYGNLLTIIETRLVANHRLSTETAPLAAHLLLSGVAPEFLVRDIPEQIAYMTSQVWVHFKHCVAYLEGKYPGSSRRLSFENIMSGERLRAIKPGYWSLREFSGPVIDWARANGVLPSNGEVFTPAEFSTAKAALLTQFDGLQSSIEALHRVDATRRESALADLLRVFPGNERLEMKVLARQSDTSNGERGGGTEPEQNVQLASCVDLHLAGQLVSDSNRWHSTLEALDFSVMAQRFHLLGDVNRSYGQGFIARDSELWTTYVRALQYSLSLMSLSHRKRLEYGTLTLFLVGQSVAGTVAKGRFGILVLCQHPAYADCAYEFFPRQITVVERTDLNARLLPVNSETVTGGMATQSLPTLLPLDWVAYDQGEMPTPGASSTVILEKFGQINPALDQAATDANLLSVPQTMTSFRIRRLAMEVLSNTLFAASLGLRASAGNAISLEDAIEGRDPWADYLKGMAVHEAMAV